jgi:sugar O-acyltransferase (sialic acid O-acetyltransferase NeuD family)
MSEPARITIPLINPNEPEALLASLAIQEREQIFTGKELCVLETTKSTHVLTAEADGYVAGLRFRQGDTVRAGQLLCYLAEDPEWRPPTETPGDEGHEPAADLPAGLRITQPALALAKAHDLDLTWLPIGPLVTENMIQSLLGDKWPEPDEISFEGPLDSQAIIVYGGGGHGKSVIDLLRALGVSRIEGVIDDGLPKNSQIMGIPVLGGASSLNDLRAQGLRLAVNAVGGIGNIQSRVKVFGTLRSAGFVCPAVAHPSAVIEASATISTGVQVFPQAYVGSEVQVGYGAIVNTGAIVSHDCVLEDLVNISPGALLAGEVRIGAQALIGMGVTVNLGVKIGAGARIGNGATVKLDVPERGLVRAGTIWPAG